MGLARMMDLSVKHFFAGGLYTKQMHLPKDHVMGKHTHTFTHLSILGKGSAIVETDEGAKIYDAPACIEIAANIEHRITALTDITWFCIHATDETDETKIDETLITEDQHAQ